MNLRQQKYKRNRLKGMNQLNAALAAGYSYTYARQACRIERLAKVSFIDALEQAGITDKYLAEHAAEGMIANKSFVIENEVVDSPDWATRHKYFDTVSKMTGRLKPEATANPVTVNVYPTKTIVFKDIDDSDSETRISGLHEPESTEGSRTDIAV